MRHRYEIVTRYFDHKWISESIFVDDATYEEAGRVAIKQAKEMDAKYGGTATWNVKIYNPDKPEYGAYYELFHGRTS